MQYSHIPKVAFIFVGFFSQVALADDIKSNEFKGASVIECDKRFHALEDLPENQNMHDRDILINAWAECWKKSMIKELDKRLLALKKRDPDQFRTEMNTQKVFNEAVQKACSGNDSIGTMGGIPFNWCRVGAYKYRTGQAIQINGNELDVPSMMNLAIDPIKREKTKVTNNFSVFIKELCSMPKDVWRKKSPPSECEKKASTELDGFEFTDDPDDLS